MRTAIDGSDVFSGPIEGSEAEIEVGSLLSVLKVPSESHQDGSRDYIDLHASLELFFLLSYALSHLTRQLF